MLLTVILAALALLSLALNLWQWVLAIRFPLHRRAADTSHAPGVTLLKPLKGCDAETEACLRSWFQQDYAGPVQVLFGVASETDPVCAPVRQLLAEHPGRDAQLVICRESLGPNAKVSSLAQLEPLARHEILVVSDADVWVPADLLANVAAPWRDPRTGLVCCFYQLSRSANLAMRWEALGVNADFWSQVLQAQSLKPIDFALGAVMATTRQHLARLGGYKALADYLADDYQLGHQIAAQGGRVVLCPLVVECRSAPQSAREVWLHQLRWARTVRVCQPVPYFFSILSDATFWPLLWLACRPGLLVGAVVGTCLLLRLAAACYCERKLVGPGQPRSWWLAPVKDLLQVAIWALAFAGNHAIWRGQRLRVTAGGRLLRTGASATSETGLASQ